MTNTEILTAVENLIVELETAKDRIAELEAQNAELVAQNEALETEVAELREEVVEYENADESEEVETLRKQVAEMQVDVQRLNERFQRTQQRMFDVENELRESRDAFDNATYFMRLYRNKVELLQRRFETIYGWVGVDGSSLRDVFRHYLDLARKYDYTLKSLDICTAFDISDKPTQAQLLAFMEWTDSPRGEKEPAELYDYRKGLYDVCVHNTNA